MRTPTKKPVVEAVGIHPFVHPSGNFALRPSLNRFFRKHVEHPVWALLVGSRPLRGYFFLIQIFFIDLLLFVFRACIINEYFVIRVQLFSAIRRNRNVPRLGKGCKD